MKKAIGMGVLLALILFAAHSPLLAKSQAPPENSILPDFQLPVPANATHRQYLGIKGSGTFNVHQIKAKAVIIEIFSMYCPYCQREAPNINNLYERIESDRDLKGKVKMIGVGAGNSPFEVDIFRKKYQVPFPLFPDNTFAIHKCLGETRTPYFFVVAPEPGGSQKVVYSKLGGIKNLDSFLQTIRDRADIE